MTEKQKFKTYLGKVEINKDEIIFKHDKGEFPISLSAYQEEHIRRFPESPVILREGESKAYIKVCNPKDTVENRVYSYYIKRNEDGRIEKAGLKTFERPSYEDKKMVEFINASERNEVVGILCFHPEQGEFIQIEGSVFMPQRNGLDAESYVKKVRETYQHKINVLKELGFKRDDFTVFFSNIQYFAYNKNFIEGNYNNLDEFSKKQRDNAYGRYNLGYIPFSESFSGIKFANSLPVNVSNFTFNNPMVGAGRQARPEDKEKYPLEDMTEALRKDKENFNKKQEEEEEVRMAM